MKRDLPIAVLGLGLLLPSLILISTGVLDVNRPEALVHPVLVVGGLLAAFALNGAQVLRIRLSHEAEAWVGTASLRFRGAGLNLAVLLLGVVLFGIILGYLFLENFQPRIPG